MALACASHAERRLQSAATARGPLLKLKKARCYWVAWPPTARSLGVAGPPRLRRGLKGSVPPTENNPFKFSDLKLHFEHKPVTTAGLPLQVITFASRQVHRSSSV